MSSLASPAGAQFVLLAGVPLAQDGPKRDITCGWLQVVASQKQLEMKYKQAQQIAVRGLNVPNPAQCSSRPTIACSVPAAALKPGHVADMHAVSCQDDWYKRAELALSKGEEELAREALRRRKAYEVGRIAHLSQQSCLPSTGAVPWLRIAKQSRLSFLYACILQDNAQQMKAQLEQQKKATDTLIGNTRWAQACKSPGVSASPSNTDCAPKVCYELILNAVQPYDRILEQKLTEAKSKKDTLKARAKSAAASRQINDMIQGLNTSNALTAFEKMEEKVMALEAESEATLQVRVAAVMLYITAVS